MNVKHGHAKWPLIAVVIADALWWLAWVIAMFIFVFYWPSETAGMEQVRVAHFFVAMHVALSFTLLYAWERVYDEQRVTRVVLFFAIFATFVDLYSVLDTFVHLPAAGGPLLALNLVQSLAIVATVLSAAGVVAYIVLLATQPIESSDPFVAAAYSAAAQPKKKHHGMNYRVVMQ